MKCKICGVSMFDKMLHRTNLKGQPDAGWMCEGCMEKKEPELFKNIKFNGDYRIIKDIESIVINDKPQ